MLWHALTSEGQVDEIALASSETPALIFKHSTRCSISSMALSRFERQWGAKDQEITLYFLDLLKFRDVSNYVSTKFNVVHESPQTLLIKGGRCVYSSSHNAIDAGEIVEVAG
jgi:bacillithiol system protein YtxJ